MASISWTFTHPSFNRTASKTISDPHMARLAAAKKATFVADGRLAAGATNADVVDALFALFLQRLRIEVLAQEQNDAATEAKAGIDLIDIL